MLSNYFIYHKKEQLSKSKMDKKPSVEKNPEGGNHFGIYK